jgi:hypothetical protein
MASYNLNINGKAYKVEADPKCPFYLLSGNSPILPEQNMAAVWLNAVLALCI